MESSKELRRRLSKNEWRQLTTTNEQEWLAFPNFPGTHLTWQKGESRRWAYHSWDLVSADGGTWATRHGRSIAAFGRNYEIRTILKNKRRNYITDRATRCELVSSAGDIVLSWTGSHFAGNAGTVMSIGGRSYAFPVRGSKYNAKVVMPAIEAGGSGSPVARFRLTCGWYRAAQGSGPRPVQVVVSPDSLPNHQMALVVAVASLWLRSWFDTPGAG